MRLIDFFDRGVALAPDGPCFSDLQRSRTYREVQAASHRIAHGLRAAGVGPGDVVATLTPNCLAAFEPVLGILRAGAVWLPLNARYAEAEIAHALVSNDATFLFHHAALEAEVAAVLPGLPQPLRGMVAIDGPTPLAPGLDGWAAGFPADPVDVPQGPDTVVAIRSTGGTTGPSKGVMIANQTYETLFACLFSTLPPGPRPVHLAAAPMSHASGTLAFASMIHGGHTVILPRADPATILECIERHRVTTMFLTPTMIYMLLDSPALPRHDYSSLRHVIYAGAPMSVEKLRQAVAAFGPVMAQAYGQAEAPFFCTILPPEEHVLSDDPKLARRLWSCGRATPFVQVEIMDAEGRLLPPGERGELVVRSNLVMKGYYKNPDATARASRFGWHHTGDVGYRDEDGYFYIVDRERDVIISGGFNIFPSEIEQVIWSHPAVKDCAVIGVPDEKWGEAIKAVVELRAGMSATEGEVVQLCRDRLGGMKAPKSVDFWAALPRSPVGKVLKRDVREHYWAGQARRV